MFIRMWKHKVNEKEIEVGRQNFTTNTVPVKEGNNTIDCPMYMDEDNDIYFKYEDNVIYFRNL